MIKNDQNGFETKAVVKLCFSGEFVRLCIPVKHLRMCPVRSSVGRGEGSNRRKETGRTLLRTTMTPRGGDLNVSFCG